MKEVHALAMPPRVYVSAPVDDVLTPSRLDAKRALLAMLVDAGLDIQEFGVSGLPESMGWNFDQAALVMDRCQGAIVIALTRHELLRPARVDEESRLETVLMPSEYVHYEGALALTKKVPTLIVAEERIRNAGIAYRGGGHFINYLPLSRIDTWLRSSTFSGKFKAWLSAVQSNSRIFLGYCGQAQTTADAVIKYLTRTLQVDVVDWSTDFGGGGTLMQRIMQAIDSSRCGIFLFTRDDPLGPDATISAPRDNVVLETGYCLASKGPERTIVIREDGAKVPTDLGGSIYLPLRSRDDISSVQEKLRATLERNL